MVASLKSEFRKLLSIRAAYILTAISLLLCAVVTYMGTNAVTTQEPIGGAIVTEQGSDGITSTYPDPDDPVEYETRTITLLPEGRQLTNVENMLPMVSTLGAILLILFMAHEYRYSTITYTLTASSSRLRVLISKAVVGTVYMLLLTLASIAVVLAFTYLAMSTKDLQLADVSFDWLYVIGRYLLYSIGTGLIALGITVLVRNLTMAVAALFVLPMLESIISVLILMSRKIDPSTILPFAALGRVGTVVPEALRQGPVPSFYNPDAFQASPLAALTLFGAYLLGVWIVAAVLFVRRDAN